MTARDATARGAVVRPLSRAAARACVRPGCPSPARATLSFRYDTREAWLERLSEDPRPECYDLCTAHATRTQPPHGWQLRDRRPREEQLPDEPPTAPERLGGEQTVALLAAALRPVPEAEDHTSAVGRRDEVVADTEPLEDTTSPVLEPLRGRSTPPAAVHEAVDVPAAEDRDGETVDRLTADDRDGEAVDEHTAAAQVVAADAAQVVAPDVAASAASRPRPVPAARERRGDRDHDRAPDGPARHW